VDYYNRFEKENKLAIITFVDDEFLSCSFFENEKIIGRIDYPNKNRNYVVDAANNWCNGVMTHETIKEYTSQPDLFS
tara:strand:- start:1646 stop:1876 length:231 start_codon:yes stop_codon:yes gene_type:complete